MYNGLREEALLVRKQLDKTVRLVGTQEGSIFQLRQTIEENLAKLVYFNENEALDTVFKYQAIGNTDLAKDALSDAFQIFSLYTADIRVSSKPAYNYNELKDVNLDL